MPDQTIVSGGSLDLTLPLASGTSIDFLNNAGASGTLRIEPSAFENLTVVTAGSTAVSTYLGGGINNFQAGDTIVIASLASAYAAFDHAPAGVTLAQNAAVANELNTLLFVENFIGPEIITISGAGVITDNTGLLEGGTVNIFGEKISIPSTIISEIDTYASSIEQALFGGGAETASVFITIGPDAANPSLADATITTDGTINVICYLRGTQILTETGEVPVESLAIGDRLVTRFGGTQPVKWIGRQSFARRFIKPADLPVRIAAGALDGILPTRPLYVSPGHSMLIGGRLVLAKSLVNGVTITQQDAPEALHYYQVEFAAHDCILAEGAWSETYADAQGMRGQFHNAAEFHPLYPEHVAPAHPALCAPRPQRGTRLAEVLRPITARAAAETTPGLLRGWVERIDTDGFIAGWAQDIANPELPVLLEVMQGERLVHTVLACDYRGDLAQARIGRGHCSFAFILPGTDRENLRIRRAGSHAALPLTPECAASVSGTPAVQLLA